MRKCYKGWQVQVNREQMLWFHGRATRRFPHYQFSILSKSPIGDLERMEN